MHIEEIWVHPIKSFRGISVQEWEIDKFGFKYDRMYSIGEPDAKAPETYSRVTQREATELALITVDIDTTGNQLILGSYRSDKVRPVYVPLDIPDHVLIKDCPKYTFTLWGQNPKSADITALCPGLIDFLIQCLTSGPSPSCSAERIAQWRLFAPLHRRTVSDHFDPGRYQLAEDANTSFQDIFPGHLVTTASIKDLGDKVKQRTEGKVAVTAARFRPNLVVKTSVPWDEDDWKHIEIDASCDGKRHQWWVVCRNVRCQIPTVNLESGKFETNREPYKTMQSFRRIDEGYKYAPCFGMQIVQRDIDYKIRVGDALRVLSRGPHKYEANF